LVYENKNNELLYLLIENEVSGFEKNILSVKMKKGIIFESKIVEEKEELSLMMNKDSNYEINKKYLYENVWKAKLEEEEKMKKRGKKKNSLDVRQDNVKLFAMVLLNSKSKSNGNLKVMQKKWKKKLKIQ
jgi:hypothetical protein